MFKFSMIFTLCILPGVLSRAITSDDAVVHTKLGIIRGMQQKFEEKIINTYLGIPFAKPPLGRRRFSLPEMIDPWQGELEARKLAQTCYITPDSQFPQFPGAEMWNPPNIFDEDCLSLNIWAPKKPDGRVMVWIYGGGFFSGSPSLDLYDGRVLASRQNVIVVNINYRLGPFGFLYFGEKSSIPGNMGLKDQQLALRWIYENIAAFGGDPRKVTLFGESAGAASATAHLFAPDSYKYFQKIIIMSGSIVNSWATKDKNMMFETSMFLAKALNCAREDEENPDLNLVTHCIRQAPASKIQRAADAGINQALPMTFPFVPVDEDDHFFKGNLANKLVMRDFKKEISVLVGSMADEGTYWLPYYLSHSKLGFQFNHTISADDPVNRALIDKDQFRQSLKSFIPYFADSQLVMHALLNAYGEVSDSNDSREQMRDGVARFVGDFFFTCDLVEFSNILADNIYGSVYMYYFTKRSSANPWPKWMGVMHGYEIEYVFGLPLRHRHLYSPSLLNTEQKFSETIMKLWTEFATSGYPLDRWPKYNKVTKKSLLLDDEVIHDKYDTTTDVHGNFCRLLSEGQSSLQQGCQMDAITQINVACGGSYLLTCLLVFVFYIIYFISP